MSFMKQVKETVVSCFIFSGFELLELIKWFWINHNFKGFSCLSNHKVLIIYVLYHKMIKIKHVGLLYCQKKKKKKRKVHEYSNVYVRRVIHVCLHQKKSGDVVRISDLLLALMMSH